MTVNELSAYLNIKVKTVYYLVSQHAIPHYRLNILIRFNREEVDRWMTSKKATSRVEKKTVRSGYNQGIGRPGYLKKEVR